MRNDLKYTLYLNLRTSQNEPILCSATYPQRLGNTFHPTKAVYNESHFSGKVNRRLVFLALAALAGAVCLKTNHSVHISSFIPRL